MRTDYSKIFVLSRQKCGTTSTGDFLRQIGISCAGANGIDNRKWGLLALSGQHDVIFNSERFRTHQAFEDDPWWMRGMAEATIDRYPDGLYILMERDANQWFDSMLAHSHSLGLGFSSVHLLEYERAEELADYLLQNRVITQNEGAFPLQEKDRVHYTDLYTKRLQQIIGIFESLGLQDRLCHVHLEDPGKWVKIGRFLGVEVSPQLEIQSNRKGTRTQPKRDVFTRLSVSFRAFAIAWRCFHSRS